MTRPRRSRDASATLWVDTDGRALLIEPHRASGRTVTAAAPVPALIDPAMFEAAREQLDENRSRKRDLSPVHPGYCKA